MGREAFARARAEDKPVFLSVGYSTCYWCHVMGRRVFSDPEIAAFMNAHFISIKVDREERPDVDDIYMKATHLLSGAVTARYPEGVSFRPAFVDEPIQVYEGAVAIPVSLPDGTAGSPRLEVSFQACDDRQCLPLHRAVIGLDAPGETVP